MDNLIYDPVGGFDRYTGTITLDYVITPDEELKENQDYLYESISCTSAVKYDTQNWFYILPYGIDKKEFQLWLNEFKDVFPTLQLKLLPDDSFSKLKLKARSRVTLGNDLVFNGFDKETNEVISFKCPLKKLNGRNYFPLKETNLTEAYVSKFENLFEGFLTYLITNKVTDNFADSVYPYLTNNLDALKTKWSNISSTFYLYISATKTAVGHSVSNPAYFIDFSKLDLKEIEEYLIRSIANNMPLVRSRVGLIDKNDRLILQALHSKKTYKAESYLAHHMIRMGISPDLNVLMRQYFLIKRSLSDIFFWNRIFLTQMGFNMHAYWWLTNSRWFRMVTEKEFFDIAKKFDSPSANSFMDKFVHHYSDSIKEHLVKLYTPETLVELYHALDNSTVIALKPEKKDKFMNLRLKEKYCVQLMEGDYYFVIGDDFMSRRYKKTNFNIIK